MSKGLRQMSDNYRTTLSKYLIQDKLSKKCIRHELSCLLLDKFVLRLFSIKKRFLKWKFCPEISCIWIVSHVHVYMHIIDLLLIYEVLNWTKEIGKYLTFFEDLNLGLPGGTPHCYLCATSHWSKEILFHNRFVK